jgi:transglutaminase-like putative cysteine protease
MIPASERQRALLPTEFLDSQSHVVRDFARQCAGGADTARERATRLFYAVRDGLRYDVYGADLRREAMRASAIVRARAGFCLHKSIVYAAAARSLDIPARLAFVDVRNHLATPRLIALVGGDVFRFHAYAEIWIDERWIKVTPVFNRTLCLLFGVAPLEFDGTHDAVAQPFDRHGNRYLEILHHHGSFDDFPFDRCMTAFRTHHPALLAERSRTVRGDLQAEAAGGS